MASAKKRLKYGGLLCVIGMLGVVLIVGLLLSDASSERMDYIALIAPLASFGAGLAVRAKAKHDLTEGSV